MIRNGQIRFDAIGPTTDSATWCRTLAVVSATRRLWPEVSKNFKAARSSNEGEFATSTTTPAPDKTLSKPSPVIVLTPVLRAAWITSWPFWRSLLASFVPMRPVRPMITILMTFPRFWRPSAALLLKARPECACAGRKAL